MFTFKFQLAVRLRVIGGEQFQQTDQFVLGHRLIIQR